MADRNEIQRQLAIAQCDEGIRWNRSIINSKTAPEEAKAAARIALAQAERAKQNILSGKTKIAAED